MLVNSKIDKWANAHTFYNVSDVVPSDNTTQIAKQDLYWRQKLKEETKNGHLITKNTFFNQLHKSKKIYLSHMTYNLDKIISSGAIYPSGGCLIGSIYCTPLNHTPEGLRMHNLGSYIYNIEAPQQNIDQKPPEALIFEIQMPSGEKDNLIGVNYLKLGDIHNSIFSDLEYLLSISERNSLKNIILDRIKKSLAFLSLVNNLFFHQHEFNREEFMDLFINTVEDLPILGYIYFEVVSEYMMLNQDGVLAKKYADLGELYSPCYKNLLYSLDSKLTKIFSLRDFKPSIDYVYGFIKDNGFIHNPCRDKIIRYISDRLVFMTNTYLFSNPGTEIIWQKINSEFKNISESLSPLIGHITHRELRSFGRYPDFYFYFDQIKALEIWNYWNYMNIAIPFNGVIPKGEVGINPAYSDLKYKVYRSSKITKNGLDYLIPTEELHVNFYPRLVDLKFSFMRSSDIKKI